MGMITYSFKRIVTAFALVVWVSLPAAADDARLDELFDQLKQADESTFQWIEDRIFEEWGKSGSPAMDLLLKRGQDAIAAGEPDAALEHFTALIDHAPDFATAYNARALAFHALGMYGPAIDDLRQAIVLNPRHFGALRGFGILLEEIGREDDALEVYRLVQALHPMATEVAEAIARLESKYEGQAL
ncbi:MAG: tetratricopeptide (TPR) repeat protein [Paracoccaceae bacterium]|jgi:tetratricopeptide (TPR) repeat protein